MLQITDDARFTATANINLKGRKASFRFEARLLPTDQLEEMQAAQRKAVEEGQDLKTAQGVFIRAFLTGWPAGEVTDKSGNALEFSEAAVAELLAQPGVPLGMVRGFYEGYEEATEGN